MGELWGVCCGIFLENLSHYHGTALYVNTMPPDAFDSFTARSSAAMLLAMQDKWVLGPDSI